MFADHIAIGVSFTVLQSQIQGDGSTYSRLLFLPLSGPATARSAEPFTALYVCERKNEVTQPIVAISSLLFLKLQEFSVDYPYETFERFIFFLVIPRTTVQYLTVVLGITRISSRSKILVSASEICTVYSISQ